MAEEQKTKEKKIYIKIPKEVINDSIEHNEKLLVYIYMTMHKSIFNSVTFSINSIMSFYKLTSRHVDANKIYNEVESIIKQYKIDKPPITTNINSILKNSTLYTIVFDECYFKISTSFAMIEINEILDIIDKKSKVSIKRVLLLLSFYRVNMNRRDKQMHDDITFKPEIWFFYGKRICTKLHLCESTCRNIIEYLEEINIIRTKRLPSYKLSNNTNANDWRSGYLMVADYRSFFESNYTWEEELDHGAAYVRKIVQEHNKTMSGEKIRD